jgi:carboxymethylenebutenolidase
MSLNGKLQTPHGTIGLYLTKAASRPLPGIVLLHEIFGVNHAMELAADRFARAGYIVAAPDLYHAIAPGTTLGYDPADRPRALELWAKLSDEDAIRDIAAVLTWLRAHPSCNGRAALLGFCLGGKLAVLAAARATAECVVSFYPVQLDKHVADMNRISCPVQVHLGENDAHVPPAPRAIMRQAVCARAENEFIIYPNAEHGFYNPIRPGGYHPRAAAEAHGASLRFLERWLTREA